MSKEGLLENGTNINSSQIDLEVIQGQLTECRDSSEELSITTDAPTEGSQQEDGTDTKQKSTGDKLSSSEDLCEKDTTSSHTILDALYDKYGTVCDEPLEFKICLATNAPGLTDSGKLIVPHVIGLNYLDIDSLGDQQELSVICRNVTELDLSHNKICDWKQVISLLQCLVQLHFLNLSYNALEQSEDLSEDDMSELSDDLPLIKLVLNKTNISWLSLWTLMAKLHNVEELHLCMNGIDHFMAPPGEVTYPKVRVVYLNDNKISDVVDLLQVGRSFPNLENLVMTGNPIQNLDIEAEVSQKTFPELRNLNLSNCKLTDWQALMTLREFPKLQGLRILGIPLTEKYKNELRRQLTIGFLPNIHCLNGTPVNREERETAERAFIRYYMSKDDRPARYDELHAVYGDLEPLVNINMEVSPTVCVTVTFDGRTKLKNFNCRWTLAKVKKELERTFVHHPVKDMLVYHEDVGGPFGPELMRSATRTLISYRVKEGDALHVELKNQNN